MRFRHLSIAFSTSLLLAATSHQLAAQADTGIKLKPRVYLQGALQGLSPTATLMRDDLRSKGYLPTAEPYTGLPNFQHKGGGGGEQVSGPTVFQVTGGNAIVDWVVVELRSPSANSVKVATRSALLQRDGDVVGVDGVSPVQFASQQAGTYRVAIRHRNHISVMSEPVALDGTPVVVNFTSPGFNANCSNSQAIIGNKAGMWSGDINRDGRAIFQGPTNDRATLLFKLLSYPANTALIANFIGAGYSIGDLNMDGNAIYAGPGNDIGLIFTSVITFPQGYNPPVLNYIVQDCIPD